MKQMILLTLLFSLSTMAQSLQSKVEMAKSLNPQLQVLQIPNLSSQKNIYILKQVGNGSGTLTAQEKAVQELIPALKSVSPLRAEKVGTDVSGGGWQHEDRVLGVAGKMLIEITQAYESDCTSQLLADQISKASLDLSQDVAISFDALPENVQKCLSK